VGFLFYNCCGREVIPSLVHEREDVVAEAKQPPGGDGDEEAPATPATPRSAHKAAKAKAAAKRQKSWDHMTRDEQRIVIARRKKLGTLSFDVQ